MKKILAFGVAFVFIGNLLFTPAFGAVRAGAACAKAGSTSIASGKTFTCINSYINSYINEKPNFNMRQRDTNQEDHSFKTYLPYRLQKKIARHSSVFAVGVWGLPRNQL